MRLESLPGIVLDQKYRIERPLGLGAMGAVFQATHLGTTRPVAIKVIMPQLADNQEFAQRFKREAEAAGRLIHPNVVNVTDFGVTKVENRELAYLVMEYLDGQSLQDYLRDNPRPAFNFLLDVMDQAGLALDASHAAGIVHRDLKPSNIWLEPNHRGGYNVKVLDFGIAKVANPTTDAERAIAADAIATMAMAPSDASLTFAMVDQGNLTSTPSNLKTSAGTLLGTPAYMAPEQCTGIEVNASADVYSVAAIAYQMLCGRLPFEAATLKDLIRQQIQTTPQSPREHDRTVPESLALVVLSGLEKDPARRPPTAGTFAARLRSACEGEITLLRKSKDAFHAYLHSVMPMLLACLSVMVVGMIPVQLAAKRAARLKLAPDGVLAVAMTFFVVVFMVFGFQLFKAACMSLLRDASENGQGRAGAGRVLGKLRRGFWELLRTQLLSMIDLRPSSWWSNILWPVVWAAEGRSGKDAIARSKQLCGALPNPSMSLAVRQYAPALIGAMAFPFVMSLTDSTGSILRILFREELAGSPSGWFFLLYPIVFGMMLAGFGPAFSFLYWSASRCRNEGNEITLPTAARNERGKTKAGKWRTGTRIWTAAPLVLLAVIVWRVSGSAKAQAMDEASGDGRRTTLLKLIDGGLGVNQLTAGGETALFSAVRDGDGALVVELLKRGANVNATSGSGSTPLLEAAESGRNGIARELLDHGGLPDASNRAGRTALMIAAMRGNAELARLLLERGANASRVDRRGKTAAVYASEEGYGELVGLLSQRAK